MLVKEFMTIDPMTVSPGDDIKVVFNQFLDNRIRQAPVVEKEKLIGIVTDRDLRMALIEDRSTPALTVKSVMSKNPIAVTEGTSIEKAARIIIEKKYNALPVVNKNKQLKGILTTTDIIEGFIDHIDSVDYKFWS
ncbi:MAG: CBS domain-containing protein [Thermodesulfobacteriota bacterium]